MAAGKPHPPGWEFDEQIHFSSASKIVSNLPSASFAYARGRELEEKCGMLREAQMSADDSPPDGPLEKKRKCRDVICLAFFATFLILMAFVAAYVFVTGSFSRLSADGWDKCLEMDMVQPKPAPLSTDFPFANTSLGSFPDVVRVSPDTMDFFSDAAVKFKDSWPNIVYMSLIALVLSLVMTAFLRIFAGIIIWMIIAVILMSGTGVSIFLWFIHMNLDSPDISDTWRNHGLAVLVGAIVASVITTILLLLTLAMRKRIALVVRLFKESGKAVYAIPAVLIQPFWTFLCQVGVIATFVCLGLLIESIEPIHDTNGNGCQPPELKTYLRWLNLFAFLWMTQFVAACQHVVVAGAVSRWFFTRDKRRLGSPLLISFKNLVRYHLGSVAFGSLIIAIVKFVRFVLNAIKKRCSGTSKIATIVATCCACCLWCLDKCLQFLCRNAYIEIAIYGYGFCPAAKRAFRIITSNALRLAAINSIGDFVLFLAKITIVTLTTICGYYIFEANLKEGETLEQEWGLLAAGAILSYFIAHCFISIYEMTVDTIFICFCEDTKMNDGTRRPYFMSKGLMEFVKISKKKKC